MTEFVVTVVTQAAESWDLPLYQSMIAALLAHAAVELFRSYEIAFKVNAKRNDWSFYLGFRKKRGGADE